MGGAGVRDQKGYSLHPLQLPGAALAEVLSAIRALLHAQPSNLGGVLRIAEGVRRARLRWGPAVQLGGGAQPPTCFRRLCTLRSKAEG